jgi:hypothetical protein
MIIYIIQIVHGTDGHLTQNYLLYYTPPTNATSIRTQLDALYGHS